MQEILLNDTLVLSCPEGFHLMTEAERSGVSLAEDGPWIGLSAPEKHILVTAGWKQVRGLAALLGRGDLAKNMEKRVRKPMQPFGYRLEGFTERSIAGERAAGFRYSYRAQGTEMYAESYALKRGGAVYYFHFYVRAAMKAESLPVWEEMLGFVRAR